MEKYTEEQRLNELAELVIIAYMSSYDIDIAMLKAEVSDEDQKILLKDPEFIYRIAYQDADIRGTIIKTMVDNMKNGKRPVSQKAAVDLGNILYKEKFSKKDEGPKTVIPDKIVLTGE